MNKTSVLFATFVISLTVLKLALAQGDGLGVSWDPLVDDPMQDVTAVMLAAPVLGLVFGASRMLRTNSARPLLSLPRLH